MVEEAGEFGDLGAVPVGELADVPLAPGVPYVPEAVAALLGEPDQRGAPVGGVGVAGDEPEVLQGPELLTMVALPTPKYPASSVARWGPASSSRTKSP